MKRSNTSSDKNTIRKIRVIQNEDKNKVGPFVGVYVTVHLTKI